MFHKPFRVKSQSAIRSSDRKKLRAEIRKHFQQLSDEILRELVPNKDEMTVMKIFTHAEDNVMVYCLKKNPIFFEVDRVLYPTVYTLWKNPDILPTFTTWAPVLSHLQRGADLMLPGVILKGPVTPQTFKHLEKGTPASVNLLPNRAPIAVGKTALSGSDMYASAMRGKGVTLHHVYKDQLWAHGDKSHPPEMGLAVEMTEELENSGENGGGPTLENDSNDTECVENSNEADDGETVVNKETDGRQNDIGDSGENRIASLCLEDAGSEEAPVSGMESHGAETGTCETGANLEESSGAIGNSVGEESGATCGEGNGEEEAEEELSETEQMDSLLYHCLLHSLKSSVKKSDYPILTSKLFRSYMVSCCPSEKYLDLKKSTYKKLSKFLQEMEKRDLLIVKELSKGVESVTVVNRGHPDLKSFVVPDLPEEEEESDEDEEKPYQPPEIAEMYGVSAAVLPLFSKAGYSKGTAMTTADVRKVLTDYVKENELKDENVKGLVILDALLSDVLMNRNENTLHFRWDELFKRCLDKMTFMHRIAYPGEKPITKKGKVEPVTLMIAQRGGNKKVTLIENLEQFGISPKTFAHEVQIGVACSTSVSPLPGKGRGMQVLVQGNQINFVSELLLGKYQLNKKYLTGLEKAPKPGKKRR